MCVPRALWCFVVEGLIQYISIEIFLLSTHFTSRNNETLPELAEDIERLACLSYPEAPVEVLETLTQDQFIDALNDDETRLKVA